MGLWMLVAGCLLAGCGANTFVQSAAPPTSTTTSTTNPGGPVSASLLGELYYLSAARADLGDKWTDLGPVPLTLDVTQPPPSCLPYAEVFDHPRATVIHEFSYLLTAKGDESGHLTDAVVAVSPSQAAQEIVLVRSSSYRACAEETAERWLDPAPAPVLMSSAQRLQFTFAVPTVGWRVAIEMGTPANNYTFYMDIVYVASGPYLEKIRVTRCECSTALPPSAGIDPGELAALTGVAQRLLAASGQPGDN